MDAPSRAGSRFGPYELRSLLGKGGMGEVYEAYDTSKDRVVALKLLPAELAKDPSYQERFRRESQAAARLAEPHIIPIHDWGEIDGVLYIDMRLVRGRDLRSLLDGSGALPPLRVIGIIEQVAAALDAAHYSGLVHRDVKPANILVTDADFAYLADFGIARAEGDSTITMTGTAVGSYAYMAPERFDAGPVSGRADIYSLGCVLHECLTGDKPFPADNMSVLIRAHLSEAPPLTSMLRGGIPPALDAVIGKALAKDPNDRFYTAGEFARAARAALAGQGMPPNMPGAGGQGAPGQPPRPGRTVP
ncbi:serine/threonine-protein kinase, partial [Nocardia sp. NPDC059764]|uniref:serine/threonine-protein kinase n=1 Tax=Nocardia sp. NPDC059764 TaxID=3346939 RepID=UPI00365D9353